MPLDQEQIETLGDAIRGYDFPPVYYDFEEGTEIVENTMLEVENIIRDQLRSEQTQDVRHGLANVLYWGYANIGYRDVRVADLNNNITVEQIKTLKALLANNNIPSMVEIKRIKMPQFSGMSFISKVLMFLNPNQYCVLDKQIASLRTHNGDNFLNQLVFRESETQIRISAHNEAVYDGWRGECRAISTEYYGNEYRVVDIERGFFQLIQHGHLMDAQAIYNAA
jgi:hypothetical protein